MTSNYEKDSEEYQYLDLAKKIIETGDLRDNRTNFKTLGLFCEKITFSLRDGKFPLLTTKKMFFRAIVEELLWMLRGETNSEELNKKQIKIWNYNGSREFLDSQGFVNKSEGDLGPIYGFQWRHWGAEYKDHKTDYSGQGIDQIAKIIDDLKNNPFSRRIILSAWNVSDLPEMALPPCHCFMQFYVTKSKELSGCLYQRSADVGLGVPFNIASYSLLLNIIANMSDLKCGDFNYVLGDMHIYENHIEQLKEQIKRTPFDSPKIKINKKITLENLSELEFSDFELENYKSHSNVNMEVSG